MAEKKRLIIIDGNSLVHRAYHALPALKTKRGELVNAVYGFCLIFLKSLRELKPDFIAATFDLPKPTFRHKEFKEYKAKRPKAPEEIYQQISKVKQVLKAFKVPIFEKQGFEADDLIGTIAREAPKQQVYPGLETIILSGDLDTLQLIDPKTKVYALKKGIKDMILYDEEAVGQRYGLRPQQMPDFKGLKGDPSDNIPGVPGVGEKTAASLIKEFDGLENLYQELEGISAKAQKLKSNLLEKLKKFKDQAFFSRELARIRRDAPLDFKLKDCQFGNYDLEKVAQVFKNFEFYTLLGRLPEPKLFKPATDVSQLKKQNFQVRLSEREEIEKLFQQGVFSKKIAELEKNLVKVVRNMEENGIKLDLKSVKELASNLHTRLQSLTSKIYKVAGTRFNLNSPQQLSEVLFKKLKIPLRNLKKTPGGAISTGAGELVKLKDIHPVIGLILKYRELFKLKTGFVDSLPKMISPNDGRIHPHFHQLGAETGRMSCSSPNLQNIPIKEKIGKEIRKCFIPEKGFLFLSADYSQMELRIAASIADDKKMQELFQKGEDIHQLTASQIFDIPLEKITEQMRKMTKTLNYGILYGMGAGALSERTGLSRKEAQEFIRRYFKRFGRIAKYIQESKEKAREKGFSQTLFGRKRFLPEINSIDPRLRAAAERMAVNLKIQGTAADIIKMAMVEIEEQGVLDSNCKMLLQIHDELLFEVKNDRVKEVAPKIKTIMQDIVQLKTPLKVEIKAGKDWGELEDVLK